MCAHNTTTEGKTDTTTSAVLNNCKFENNWDWKDGGTSGKLTDIKIEFDDTLYPNRIVDLKVNNTTLVTKTENNTPIKVEYNGKGYNTTTCNIAIDGVSVISNANYVVFD